MAKKIKIGIFGGARGASLINCCNALKNAEVVAVCDKSDEVIAKQKKANAGLNIAYYSDFENFIGHDMDAVVLANYATEHAPFAIRCMKAGKHVYSEVLPCQTMAEAVALVEAVEETGMTYAYGENYCYMAAPYEMYRRYKNGDIGEFEYAECEYIHNCTPIWPELTYGEEDHWRNNTYSTFYCTHSIGPIIHITGLRPVSVVAFEGLYKRSPYGGSKSADYGFEIIKLENGGYIKSIHGNLYKNSIWYSIYGAKGRMESAREDTHSGSHGRIYVNADRYPGEYGEEKIETYLPDVLPNVRNRDFGHGGSDFFAFYNFIEKLCGNKEADTIDVYTALDMFLPGLLGYRSILSGNIPVAIPNLRNPEERDVWRNDNACTDPMVAKEQLLPTMATGTPIIDAEVYSAVKNIWDQNKEKNN